MFYIRGRRVWKARKPIRRDFHNWKTNKMTVVVHHAADNGPKSLSRKHKHEYLRGIQSFHMGAQRCWSDIAYNYIVMADGSVYEGRGFGVIGAHAPGWNKRGIGVCFAGDGREHVSPQAVAAYHKLIKRLKKHGANIVSTAAHGDVYPTTCPGNAIRKALDL